MSKQYTSNFGSLLSENLSRSHLLLLDGAMGTILHVNGLPDPHVLSEPELIATIHRQYIEAGADIITTNTFNANAISLSDYGVGDKVAEINRKGAEIAVDCARTEAGRSGRKIWVAGTCGPSSRLACRCGSSDELSELLERLTDAYAEQVQALANGCVDVLLFETVCDIRNLKSALAGASRAFSLLGFRLPIMVSATVNGSEGKLPSGDTLKDLVSLIESQPDVVSVGLNCGVGPQSLLKHISHLSSITNIPISCHPSAGLPDEQGKYPETPDSFARSLHPALTSGIISIVGGCCGTTPAHISALAPAKRIKKPKNTFSIAKGCCSSPSRLE